jgi:hypothetical protein
VGLHRRQRKLVDISAMAAEEALMALDLADAFRATLERHDEVPATDLTLAKGTLAAARTRIEHLRRELRGLRG